MPAPTLATVTSAEWGQLAVCKFGGRPLPGTNINAPYADLNDGILTFIQGREIGGSHIKNSLSQLTWQGDGVWTGQDFVGRKITVPILFDPTAGDVGAFVASLSQSGEQYLTFDGVTGILAKFDDVSTIKHHEDTYPYLLECSLVFQTRGPFAQDLAQSTATFSISSVGYGTYTLTNNGNVFTKPVFSIVIPSGSAVNTVVFGNSATSNIYVSTSAIPSGNHTVIIDCVAQRILVDATEFPPAGTFPSLFAGSNTITYNLVGSLGSAASAGIAWTQRYEVF